MHHRLVVWAQVQQRMQCATLKLTQPLRLVEPFDNSVGKTATNCVRCGFVVEHKQISSPKYRTFELPLLFSSQTDTDSAVTDLSVIEFYYRVARCQYPGELNC